MSTTPVYTVSNPAANTRYYAPSASYWCVPNSGTSVTCTVESFDSNGNLLSVSSLTAAINVENLGVNTNSYTYNGGNSVQATSSTDTNGSNVFRAGGWTGASGVGYLKMWLTYTGKVYDQAPNTPTNLSPSGLITTLSPTMTATFSDPTSGDYFAQYEVQVTNAANGGGSVIWDTGNTATNSTEQSNSTLSVVYGGTGLAFGSQYSWRVRMANQNGLWSGWSGWVNFNTASGPNTPSSVTPNGIQTSLTPVWSFYYSSPGGYAMQAYRYQVVNGAGSVIYDTGNVAFASNSGTTVSASIPSGYLTWGASYTFKVVAEDSNGAWSSWASSAFNVAARPTATQNSPVGNATVNTQTPTFSWTFSDPNYGQYQYQVKVYNNSTGALIQDSGVVTSSATSWTETTAIAYGTSAYWTIQVWDTAGLASDIYTAHFLVNNSPTAAVTSPSAGAVLTTVTPTITWTYTPSASNYAQASALIIIQDSNGNQLASYTQSGAGTSYTLAAGVLFNTYSYKVEVQVTDTNAGTGTSPAVAFSIQYTAPADLQGQPLASDENCLLSPELNVDGGAGVPLNWTYAANGSGSASASYAIDPNVPHPEALASGDGQATGAWHVSLASVTGVMDQLLIGQNVNLSDVGAIPGISTVSLSGYTICSQLSGVSALWGAQMSVIFYNVNTQTGFADGSIQADTAGAAVRYLGPQNILIPAGTTRMYVTVRLKINQQSGISGDVWWYDVQAEVTRNAMTDPYLNIDGGTGVASGWTSTTASGVTAAYSIDTTMAAFPAAPSTAAQKIVVSADTAAIGQMVAVNQQVTLASLGLAPGQVINSGAYVIVANGTGAPIAKVALEFNDINGTLLSSTNGATTQGSTAGAWVFLAGPQNMTIPTGAVTAKLRLKFFSVASGDTGTVWWTGALLGLATSASDPNFISGAMGTGYAYDTKGYSIRSYLAGALPTVLANTGSASDPTTAQGGSVIVSWDTSLADARFTYYLLERRRADQQTNDTAWETLATISNKNLGSYIDFAAGNGVTYQYSIRQVVTYADGTTGMSQHRAIVAGSVVFGAYYLTNTAGSLINLRLNTVSTARDLEWKEQAVYTPFLGRSGQARDAGPDLGYAFSLDAYFSESWGDDPDIMRRVLLQMQQLGVQWLYRDPTGVVIPVWLQGIKWKMVDNYGDRLMSVTFTMAQAQATVDY